MILTLILAVLLDHWLGEPQKYHPLVFFGKLATRIEINLHNPNHPAFRQKILGVLAALLMVTPLTLFIHSFSLWPMLDSIFAPVILYFCIAANSLKRHALLVFQALEKNDLPSAKNRVAMIVSRQSENMTINDVRKATIESVLENGADAVFAPLSGSLLLDQQALYFTG